ncbi:hypothetical protein Cfor_10551 [Coptotermes formosanus]|uniref:SGNH hydrolase-type esterase domain-containing protein n=1 Tax=Coptotermes formosanus TaxID=36987 RepID=A0A6L2Q194_COPFO|nr:hypothetical protein Cfor_10551 [Coptotermes formosanus]
MADVNMDKFFLAPGFSDLSAVNSETERECCLKLKQELTETLCELSSAQKIIQLLQEDKKSQHQYNNRSTNEDKMNQVMDFEVITNKTNNRNSQGISTSEWKSYVRGKNYQQQLIPVIINCHVRGCAMELSKYLQKDFEVTGTVMPGARLKNIICLATKEISSLNKDDAVIIWGGSNDINKNEVNIGLKYLKYFVTNTLNTNIFVITAPTTYDLAETSCINMEIQVFKKKLHKLMKLRCNMIIINTNLNKDDFTQYGLHLISSGKERMVEMIGKHIHQLMLKKESPIILQWDETQNVSIHE